MWVEPLRSIWQPPPAPREYEELFKDLLYKPYRNLDSEPLKQPALQTKPSLRNSVMSV